MKKSRKENFWHGKIKYKDNEEETEDPADVDQMIRKGSEQSQENQNFSYCLNTNIILPFFKFLVTS